SRGDGEAPAIRAKCNAADVRGQIEVGRAVGAARLGDENRALSTASGEAPLAVLKATTSALPPSDPRSSSLPEGSSQTRAVPSYEPVPSFVPSALKETAATAESCFSSRIWRPVSTFHT